MYPVGDHSYWIEGEIRGYWPTAQAVRYSSAGDVSANRAKAERVAVALDIQALPEDEPAEEPPGNEDEPAEEPWPGASAFMSQSSDRPDAPEFRHQVTDEGLRRQFEGGTNEGQQGRY
jgi:hypothetical protein